jgi:hypothetical protein
MLQAQHVSSSIGTQACAPRGWPARGGMIEYHGMIQGVMRQ